MRTWAKARRHRSGLSNSAKQNRPSNAGISSIHATAKVSLYLAYLRSLESKPTETCDIVPSAIHI